ncbi:MAG: hypothetical protein C4582_07075 [Desulfobacteraceae bacterium]|jgi:Cu/Ag efflux protein CusF|nr:MAG: hypothetical protein C4582_07075 [Desulfobacteraceae bacterium]
MKKILVMVVAAFFLFSGLVMAAAPVNPVAPAAAKKAVMSATGIVKELTDQMLKVERKVKGKVEVMDFVLKAPVSEIKVGDKVKVNYVVEAGKNIATKVKKSVPKAKGQPSAPPVPPGTGAPTVPAAK